MLHKLFILIVILWSVGLNAHAQLRAERKALRILCRRILPNVNSKKFYPNDSAAIYYDGTVAPCSVGDWWSIPLWYKDERGVPRRHPLMADYGGLSDEKWQRLRNHNAHQLYVINKDFDTATYIGDDEQHDLRQRDSLEAGRLPVYAPLRPVFSAAYQRALLLEGYGSSIYYLTVHRALVGRRYVLVGLVVAGNARCPDHVNVPVMVLLHKRTLRLVDWWYTIERPRRD